MSNVHTFTVKATNKIVLDGFGNFNSFEIIGRRHMHKLDNSTGAQDGGVTILVSDMSNVTRPYFQLYNSYTPPSSAIPMNSGKGSISWNSNYIFVQVNSTTWKRVALSSF